MFRTAVSIKRTTCPQALISPKCHLLCQDAPCPRSLELESWRTGGHLDMSCNAQETCLYRMNNFSKALISPKCHLLCQDAPRPRSLKLESWMTGGHPDRSWYVQDTCLYRMNNFSKAIISPKCHLLCQDCPPSMKSEIGVLDDRGSSRQELVCLRHLPL